MWFKKKNLSRYIFFYFHNFFISGEKPFSCTFCSKQFRQLSTLSNHIKIHTGEKPFECIFCKKQFRQSSTLNNHIKVHASEKFDTGITMASNLDEVAVLKVEPEYTN